MADESLRGSPEPRRRPPLAALSDLVRVAGGAAAGPWQADQAPTVLVSQPTTGRVSQPTTGRVSPGLSQSESRWMRPGPATADSVLTRARVRRNESNLKSAAALSLAAASLSQAVEARPGHPSSESACGKSTTNYS